MGALDEVEEALGSFGEEASDEAGGEDVGLGGALAAEGIAGPEGLKVVLFPVAGLAEIDVVEIDQVVHAELVHFKMATDAFFDPKREIGAVDHGVDEFVREIKSELKEGEHSEERNLRKHIFRGEISACGDELFCAADIA